MHCSGITEGGTSCRAMSIHPGVCWQIAASGPLLTLSFSFTEHAAVLLHRAFLVGMYSQIDTSSQISEALKVLHMEATI